MAETIIMKGALEDHLGRILHPDTEADQVIRPNGQTVEESLAAILASFSNYLPITGGTITGDLKTTNGSYRINKWGSLSVGGNGLVMFADNAYIHPTNNTYHFCETHGSKGAKGICLRSGVAGIWYFDTGSVATTANATFTPTFISITDKSTKSFTGNLNDIAENTIVDGNGLTNGPGADWYYIQHIAHSANSVEWATQIAYAFNTTDVKRRSKQGGVWSAWEPFMTQSNTPTQHYSTVAPTSSDGKDGDVWDVYV